MPARNLAMENQRQHDQTDQEKKSQPLRRSNSFHLFNNDLTVFVSRVRSIYDPRLVKDLYFTVEQKSSA